jgi:hypothetical protein
MSYLLDLQVPQQQLDSGSRAYNPLSTLSAGMVCLFSSISLSLC